MHLSAWLENARCLCRDYEELPENHEGVIGVDSHLDAGEIDSQPTQTIEIARFILIYANVYQHNSMK